MAERNETNWLVVGIAALLLIVVYVAAKAYLV